jgi:hypothetical protein
MRRHGFELAWVLRKVRADGIDRGRLAARWRDLSQEDLHCAAAFIVARKA